MAQLAGQVAVVTGASPGIGPGMARALAQAGGKIMYMVVWNAGQARKEHPR